MGKAAAGDKGRAPARRDGIHGAPTDSTFRRYRLGRCATRCASAIVAGLLLFDQINTATPPTPPTCRSGAALRTLCVFVAPKAGRVVDYANHPFLPRACPGRRIPRHAPSITRLRSLPPEEDPSGSATKWPTSCAATAAATGVSRRPAVRIWHRRPPGEQLEVGRVADHEHAPASSNRRRESRSCALPWPRARPAAAP